MFGFIRINKPELKIREYERYKSFYCGLCRELKCQNGTISQLTLTYDMTFLIVLLSSLYEPKENREKHRCVVHPGKHSMTRNEITSYGADMNVLLSYYHFQDDWQDEKKLSGLIGEKTFSGQAKKIAKKYPRQAKVIQQQLQQLQSLEKNQVMDVDEISAPFGTLLSELFVWREDAFAPILREMGFHLGTYIYLLDAYLDAKEDKRKSNFNPFIEKMDEDGFDEEIKGLLDRILRAVIVEFEKLPLEQDLTILRNILYEGAKLSLIDKGERKHDA